MFNKLITALSALVCLSAASENGKTLEFDPIDITLNGKVMSLYATRFSWSTPKVSGDKAEIDGNGRMYFSTMPNNTAITDPDQIFKVNLLGGSIEYDIDLSGSECGCNTGIYMVQMPTYTQDGSLNKTDGYYYCGGNVVGAFCPEFDIMEANKYAFRSTIHTCDDPDENGWIADCERGGVCPLDQYSWKDQFGDKGSKIDTNKPFSVKAEFHTERDELNTLTGYTITMTQGNNTFVLDTDDGTSKKCDEAGKMGGNMVDGMALVFSFWGTDTADRMSWLTHGVCEGGCGKDTAWSSVSNIRITELFRPDDDDTQDDVQFLVE